MEMSPKSSFMNFFFWKLTKDEAYSTKQQLRTSSSHNNVNKVMNSPFNE